MWIKGVEYQLTKRADQGGPVYEPIEAIEFTMRRTVEINDNAGVQIVDSLPAEERVALVEQERELAEVTTRNGASSGIQSVGSPQYYFANGQLIV